MTTETKALTLIRTKLQRPRMPKDLILRRRLLDELHAGSEGKLTFISAMAGAGRRARTRRATGYPRRSPGALSPSCACIGRSSRCAWVTGTHPSGSGPDKDTQASIKDLKGDKK
jgi:hypothetical protein